MKQGFSGLSVDVEQLLKSPGAEGSKLETCATFEKARVLHTDRGW